MNILILGGNRFFGKQLAERLLLQGHQLTILNRGNWPHDLSGPIQHILCDRTNATELEAKLGSQEWDLVYDQICYDFEIARASCELFKGRVGRYIFTSTGSVYDPKAGAQEADFDPTTYTFTKLETQESDYGEAKRQAEVAFHRHSSFPVVSMRFPFVLGTDDYTRRLHFHIERIQQGLPIYFPNLAAKTSFISSAFAAESLEAIGHSSFEGPLNVASPQPVALKTMIRLVEESSGQLATLASSETDGNHSPYGIDQDRYLDISLMLSLGLDAPNTEEWLPKLVSELCL